MPQPLSKILAVPTSRITLGPKFTPNQAGLASLVAQAIATWSSIDHALGEAFVNMLGAKAAPAIAMYQALSSSVAQISTIRAVAAKSLTDKEHEIFIAFMKIYSSNAKQRNKFAHWIWIYCEQAENFIILTNPAHLLSNHRIMFSGINKDPSTEMEFLFIQDKMECYSKNELIDINKTFVTVLNISKLFMLMICSDLPSPLSKDEIYQRLLIEPLLHKALSQLREGQKNNQEARDKPPL
jgi:hypothetical protein